MTKSLDISLVSISNPVAVDVKICMFASEQNTDETANLPLRRIAGLWSPCDCILYDTFHLFLLLQRRLGDVYEGWNGEINFL